jgi:hypothetical protein
MFMVARLSESYDVGACAVGLSIDENIGSRDEAAVRCASFNIVHDSESRATLWQFLRHGKSSRFHEELIDQLVIRPLWQLGLYERSVELVVQFQSPCFDLVPRQNAGLDR